MNTTAAAKGHPRQESAAAGHRTAQYLATLAHELRQPLASIATGLALLRVRVRGQDRAAAGQTLDMMERQVHQMARLVDDLLDEAGIVAGGKVALRRQRVALDAILDSAIETSQPLVNARAHRLLVDRAPEPLVLEADASRLVQVLVNLLGNAAKYTPAGGRISLRARREGQEAVVSVADNGTGIAAPSLARVFELFHQTGQHLPQAQGGRGIGLALVRRLVELHGGTVSAASAGAGQGSTFTVRLPLAAAALAAKPDDGLGQPGAPCAAPARGLRILLVDDQAESAGSLARLLELREHGHVVAVAHEGHEALALARRFKPEVAFLDIGLPGMDGYGLARALRRIEGLQAMVLVALTGWSDQNARAHARAAGMDHHLSKPLPIAALDALLCKLAC